MKSHAQMFNDLFCELTPRLRREAYVFARMKQRGTNFSKIAKDNGLGSWYLSACTRGVFKLSRECRHALEKDLEIDLEPFMLEGEQY